MGSRPELLWLALPLLLAGLNAQTVPPPVKVSVSTGAELLAALQAGEPGVDTVVELTRDLTIETPPQPIAIANRTVTIQSADAVPSPAGVVPPAVLNGSKVLDFNRTRGVPGVSDDLVAYAVAVVSGSCE